LISGGGSNMQRLLEDMDETHPGCARLVLSNRPDAGGLAKAQAMGVGTEVLDHRPFGENRAQFETELHKILKAYQIDVICLAGFMRILGTDFVSAWRGRMLNIHPSLLPKYQGLHTHQRALEAGDRRGDALCMRLCRNWMRVQFWGKVRCPSCPAIRRKISQIVFWSRSTCCTQKFCGLF
jgi:phosphoribosylglycinamide formyltransferase-1